MSFHCRYSILVCSKVNISFTCRSVVSIFKFYSNWFKWPEKLIRKIKKIKNKIHFQPSIEIKI